MRGRYATRARIVAAIGLAAPTCAGSARAGAPQLVIDGGTTVTPGARTSIVLQGDLLAVGTLVPGPGRVLALAGYGAPSLVGAPAPAGLTLALHGTASLAQPTTLNGH